MQKRARILFKLILTAVLSLLFIWLIYTDEKVLQKHLTQPQGELVRAEDVMILAGELGKALDDSGRETVLEGELKAFQNQYFPQSESGPAQYVSYEAYIGLLDLLLKKMFPMRLTSACWTYCLKRTAMKAGLGRAGKTAF